MAALPDPNDPTEPESDQRWRARQLSSLQGWNPGEPRRSTARYQRAAFRRGDPVVSRARRTVVGLSDVPRIQIQRSGSGWRGLLAQQQSQLRLLQSDPARELDPKVDKRQNYRLVAAVWLDKPNFFALTYPGPAPGARSDGKPLPLGAAPEGVTFQNDDTNPLVIGAVAGSRPCSTRRQPGCHLRHAAGFEPSSAATIPTRPAPITRCRPAPPEPTT